MNVVIALGIEAILCVAAVGVVLWIAERNKEDE